MVYTNNKMVALINTKQVIIDIFNIDVFSKFEYIIIDKVNNLTIFVSLLLVIL